MSEWASGKGHRDENFPVASLLLARESREPIMAFYRFARAADDIADHAEASDQEKLAGLASMRAGLDGIGAEEAMALAAIARDRGLDLTHAHELLDAFVQDVTVSRYAEWDDLLAYCRLSAMPVGRFVLDVHGEDRACWPLSDALCAALQIVNHLQDCGKDYRAIDRVYLPMRMLDAAGVEIEALGAPRASSGLRAVVTELAERTAGLLRQSAPFAPALRSRRLGAEVAIIQRLAEDLTAMLQRHDPLCERTHHSKTRMIRLAAGALLRYGVLRISA